MRPRAGSQGSGYLFGNTSTSLMISELVDTLRGDPDQRKAARAHKKAERRARRQERASLQAQKAPYVAAREPHGYHPTISDGEMLAIIEVVPSRATDGWVTVERREGQWVGTWWGDDARGARRGGGRRFRLGVILDPVREAQADYLLGLISPSRRGA